jgi:hypothetical protein
MNKTKSPAWLALLLLLPVLFSCSTLMGGGADQYRLSMTGAEETPPVQTSASGTGVVTVNPDQTISGSFTTSGAAITVAHIHVGPAGKPGPVIIPLTRTGDNTWVVPAGARLTDEQYARYKAGELYVNFHTKTNPGGEIRAQIRR